MTENVKTGNTSKELSIVDKKSNIKDNKGTEKKIIKGKNGGYRPGSGRKPILVSDARQLFNKAVDERWNDIMAELDRWLAKEDNKEILKYIIDQRIGKAPQGIHIHGNLDIKANLVSELVENLHLIDVEEVSEGEQLSSKEDKFLSKTMKDIEKEIQEYNSKAKELKA